MEIRPWILVALLVAAPAAAQTYPDAEGDTSVRVLNQWHEDAPGWDGVDLVSLTLTEDPSTFRFAVEVVGFSGPTETRHDAATYFITLAHGGRPHAVSLVRNGLEDAWYGNLYEVDPGTGNVRWLGPLDARGSDAERGGWVEVPRHHLLDRFGSAPGAGGLLEDVTVHALSHSAGLLCCFNLMDLNRGNLAEARDLLDAGDHGVLYGGGESTGPVRLVATHPYRASNGGATTLRYEVEAVNSGDDGTFVLEARDVPDGWSVTLPGRLELPAGGRAAIPVLVETPFVHQHGTSSGFQVVLTDEGDAATRASTTLGVHYLTTPQPSGHHPRLWLHAVGFGETSRTVNPALGGADGRLYMNAVEDDPGDERVEVTMGAWGVGGGQYRLHACLEPGLLMGLDLDLARTGRVELPVVSDVPTEAELSGRLVHLGPGAELRSCHPGSWGDRKVTPLASFRGTPAGLGGTPTTLEADLTPLPDGDRVAYQSGAQLALEIVVQAGPEAVAPGLLRVAPGGLLDLPLVEYRDSRPAGLVGEPVVTGTGNGTTAADLAGAGRESPGPGLAWLVLGVVAVAVARVRRP